MPIATHGYVPSTPKKNGLTRKTWYVVSPVVHASTLQRPSSARACAPRCGPSVCLTFIFSAPCFRAPNPKPYLTCLARGGGSFHSHVHMCLQIDAAAAPSDLPWPSPLPWCKGEVQISMVRAQVSDAPYFQSLAFPSSYMVMNLSVFSIQGDPVNLVCGRRRRQCTFTPPSPPPDPIPRHPSTTLPPLPPVSISLHQGCVRLLQVQQPFMLDSKY
jgi:hypothetical protein